MKVDIGMKGQQREAVGQLLNAVLADQHVLYVKTRNFHWNVVGPQFIALHELLEEQYTPRSARRPIPWPSAHAPWACTPMARWPSSCATPG